MHIIVIWSDTICEHSLLLVRYNCQTESFYSQHRRKPIEFKIAMRAVAINSKRRILEEFVL
jgi:hypothetical protein